MNTTQPLDPTRNAEALAATLATYETDEYIFGIGQSYRLIAVATFVKIDGDVFSAGDIFPVVKFATYAEAEAYIIRAAEVED